MDACNCQTLTATPAEPGELPTKLALKRFHFRGFLVAFRDSCKGSSAPVLIGVFSKAPVSGRPW